MILITLFVIQWLYPYTFVTIKQIKIVVSKQYNYAKVPYTISQVNSKNKMQIWIKRVTNLKVQIINRRQCNSTILNFANTSAFVFFNLFLSILFRLIHFIGINTQVIMLVDKYCALQNIFGVIFEYLKPEIILSY